MVSSWGGLVIPWLAGDSVFVHRLQLVFLDTGYKWCYLGLCPRPNVIYISYMLMIYHLWFLVHCSCLLMILNFIVAFTLLRTVFNSSMILIFCCSSQRNGLYPLLYQNARSYTYWEHYVRWSNSWTLYMWHKYSNYMIYLNHDHESLQLDMSLLCFGAFPQTFPIPNCKSCSRIWR